MTQSQIPQVQMPQVSNTTDQCQNVIASESGDKLNQLSFMLQDRKFLVCLAILLSIIFIYLVYRFELAQFRSAFQQDNTSFEKYTPLDDSYVDQQYSSLNKQREELIDDQKQVVNDSQDLTPKMYSRF